MKQRYLEVSYRKGRPLAAYLYLPRTAGAVSARTEKRQAGLLVDFAADGRALGIEITAPTQVTLAALNGVLAGLKEEPVTADELAPLLAAPPTASPAA